jgi:hypothetical protein
MMVHEAAAKLMGNVFKPKDIMASGDFVIHYLIEIDKRHGRAALLKLKHVSYWASKTRNMLVEELDRIDKKEGK